MKMATAISMKGNAISRIVWEPMCTVVQPAAEELQRSPARVVKGTESVRSVVEPASQQSSKLPWD